MGNIQHREEGWSRSTTTAVFPRANFSESKAIKESCLSFCVLYKHITLCLPQTNLFYGLQGRQGGTLKNETGNVNALEPYFRSLPSQQKPAFPLPPSIKVGMIQITSVCQQIEGVRYTTVGQHTPHLFTSHLGCDHNKESGNHQGWKSPLSSSTSTINQHCQSYTKTILLLGEGAIVCDGQG